MSDEKVIYEPHPVTPERKKELRDQGYKILDAVFDPDQKPAKEAKPEKDQKPAKEAKPEKDQKPAKEAK